MRGASGCGRTGEISAIESREYMSVRPSVCMTGLSVCLPACMSFCLPAYFPTCLPASLTAYQPIYVLPTYLPTCLSTTYLSTYVSVCFSASCLSIFIFLPTCLSVCFPAVLSINIYLSTYPRPNPCPECKIPEINLKRRIEQGRESYIFFAAAMGSLPSTRFWTLGL